MPVAVTDKQSKRCKVKLLRILIMFSFMMFVHRNIMDALSFVFIEQSRALVVTVALLVIYIINSVSDCASFIFNAASWQ